MPVRNKIETFVAPDPVASLRAEDPWRDFRQVEKIDLHWEQTYRHSLGKYSRFFIELEGHKLFATRCPQCGKVWLPPRPACADDLHITEWIELDGRGTLEGFSILHSAPAFIKENLPYILAYVRLAGADTLFAHVLRNCGSPDELRIGMRVRVAYANEPVEHPIQLMWFEPDVEPY